MRKQKIIILALVMFSFDLAAQIDTTFDLWMWTTGKHTFWDGNSVQNYGFTIGIDKPNIPGPILRVTEGDSVVLQVRNQSQGAPHSVHLHGLDVNQENDGVPATSWDIKHRETKNYKFKATHPGTFLYHCHVATVLHVQFGMYGTVIVDPKVKGNLAPGYIYGRDFNLLFSEADKSWFDNKPKHSRGDSVYAEFSIPKYEPDYFMVNGKGKQQIDTLIMRPDENVLIRLSGVGYYQNLVKFPSTVTATLVTSDGRILPQVKNLDSIYITPGERYGVLLSPIGKNNGVISIEYQNMNTGITEATELVPYTWDETLGFDAIEGVESVELYPIPTNDNLNVILPKQSNAIAWSIFDLTGRLQIQSSKDKAIENDFNIDVSSLNSGVYTFILYPSGFAKKFVVK